MTERVTLITGASAGIGTELARIFASNGHRVALVARRADRLTALATEIAAAGGAAPIVIPCDLEQPTPATRLPRAWPPQGVEVEYVVNNAGYGLFGNAIELDRADQLGIIAVNIRALTDLSLRFSDQSDPASRRHPQCRLDRRLSAGAGNGGVLCVQGLCAVVQRSAAQRARASRRPRHRAMPGAGAVGISAAGRVRTRI